MDVLIDRMEAYKIMTEVFYEFIPDNKKIEALAQAAERIAYEIKDTNIKKKVNDDSAV